MRDDEILETSEFGGDSGAELQWDSDEGYQIMYYGPSANDVVAVKAANDNEARAVFRGFVQGYTATKC